MSVTLSAAKAGPASRTANNAPKILLSIAILPFLFSDDCLSCDDNVLTLAGVPRDHQPLDDVEDPEQHDPDQRQDHECCEHRRQFKVADRALQHETKAVV